MSIERSDGERAVACERGIGYPWAAFFGLPKKNRVKEEESRMLKHAMRLTLVLFVLGMASSAFAQKATVLRVVVVKTDNVAAYQQHIEKGREILKKMGVQANIRVWPDLTPDGVGLVAGT
jgi:hypothetical protein